MPLLSRVSRFVALCLRRSPDGENWRKEMENGIHPRSAMAFAERLLAQNPNPSDKERLDALRRGIEWSAKDPYMWERRVVPHPHGGFTVPFVKIGRR